MSTNKNSIYRYLRKKFKALKFIARQKQLVFSSQDMVSNNIIALDSRKRELVYLPFSSPAQTSIINLHELSECSVIKDYKSIKAGDLKKNKLRIYLQTIFLSLKFKNDPVPVKLALYQSHTVNNGSPEKAEAQAKKWQTLISNTHVVDSRIRA